MIRNACIYYRPHLCHVQRFSFNGSPSGLLFRQSRTKDNDGLISFQHLVEESGQLRGSVRSRVQYCSLFWVNSHSQLMNCHMHANNLSGHFLSTNSKVTSSIQAYRRPCLENQPRLCHTEIEAHMASKIYLLPKLGAMCRSASVCLLISTYSTSLFQP